MMDLGERYLRAIQMFEDARKASTGTMPERLVPATAEVAQ